MIWNDDFPPLNLWNYSLADYWDNEMKKETIKPRNPIIRAAFKNEIDLKTQVVKDKSKYNRKEKHKKKEY
jgi:hypothetical protein